MWIDGKRFYIVFHSAFIAKETFQGSFIDDFSQSHQYDIEILIVCSIVLEFSKELFKLAFWTALETVLKHVSVQKWRIDKNN